MPPEKVLTPEREFSETIIKCTTPRYGIPETEFLDYVTESILERAIFDKGRVLKYIGISGIMFPSHFSFLKRSSTDNKPYPSMHRTEFIVKGIDGKIKVKFCYLKPVMRGLRANSNGRWTVLGYSPRSINGVSHSSGNEEPIKKVLDLGEFKLSELMKECFEDVLIFKERRNEYQISPEYKYVYEESENSIYVKVACRPLGTNKAIVAVEITNTSKINTSLTKGYSLDDVAKNSFYGAHSRIEVSECKIEDMLSTDSNIFCNNINTFPVISKENSQEVFSSPMIVYDSLSHLPVKLEMSFTEITESERKLKESLYLLTEKQKKFLESGGKISKILEIIRALGKSLEDKVTNMHKFQWDAIQMFIAKIIDGKTSPMIIRAPTGSGKSLVFYTCCVLMKELSDDLRGTITFVTFPTRALNSQQFGEMIKFVFNLNKAGIEISLGMYMGSNSEGAVRTLDPREYKDGDSITTINECPACGNQKIIASKPNENRIIPKCANTKCGESLPFIFLSNWETEKYCPNIVVGTPDKLINSLSHNVYSHSIFGAPCRKCSNCKSCKPLCDKYQNEVIITCDVCNTGMSEQNNFSSTPCFIVFDEIHTLSGTQGNLFSHFLSLMKVLNKSYGNHRNFWYLGATATVANQNELLYNLTGYPANELVVFPNKEEYFVNNDKGYFEINKNLKHRYVILEPLTLSTRGSISLTVNNISDCIYNAKKLNLDIIKNLASMNIDVEKSFGTQTVYVLRKDDGRDIEKYIPENAEASGIKKPRIMFGSGDLSSEEISQLNKKVKANELDVLVVTQIYGQGVDFPGLNILHFFGTPRMFIEFHQVVGRTGRSKVPGIVIIHPSPSIPRDEWVYHNFRKMMIDIDGYYEPTPINYANKYAITLSIPNIIHTLLMTYAYKDHNMRFADYVYEKISSDKSLLDKIMDDAVRVYVREETRDLDKEEIRREVGTRLLEILMEFRNYKNPVKEILTQKNILIGTLRRQNKKIPYLNRTYIPVLEKLKTSRS